MGTVVCASLHHVLLLSLYPLWWRWVRLPKLNGGVNRIVCMPWSCTPQGVAEVVSTVAADSRHWARDQARAATFDRVLVDAPCAGLGVLAKRADLRWRRELSDLVELTALQVRSR